MSARESVTLGSRLTVNKDQILKAQLKMAGEDYTSVRWQGCSGRNLQMGKMLNNNNLFTLCYKITTS